MSSPISKVYKGSHVKAAVVRVEHQCLWHSKGTKIGGDLFGCHRYDKLKSERADKQRQTEQADFTSSLRQVFAYHGAVGAGSG